MIDFELTEEQKMIVESVREFGESKIAPIALEMEEKKEIPRDVVKGMAELGLIACTVDEKYGGAGLDAVTAGLIAGELARADPTGSIPVFYLVQAAWGHVFNKYGTEEAKQEIFPKVTKGDWFLGIATTESNIGSDLANMRTKIQPTENGYVLNGEKMYISGVREAYTYGGGHMTLARQDLDAGTRGMTFAFVPLNKDGPYPGITPTYVDDLGREGMSTGGFTLDNVEIPKEYLIGEEKKGFYIVHEGYEYARALIANICANAGMKAIEDAMEYAKERKAFGRPIAKFQGVQFPLVEGYTKMQALHHLAMEALWAIDQEQKGKVSRFEVSKRAAMAKMFAMDWSMEAINNALQVYGAFGYTKECPAQAALRAVRSFGWAEGTREIMKIIVARETLGKEYISYK